MAKMSDKCTSTYPYGSEVVILGGCVRMDKDGIYLHENSTHASIGISSVEVDRHFLKINFTQSAPVVAINISTDETIGGARGIFAGGSGGGAYIHIAFYDTRIGRRLDLSNPSDYNRISSTLSNVWFTVTHLKR